MSTVKQLLAAHGLSPRKFLGQNFMVDSNFAAAIARDAALDERTLVLEVGPGTGCLTHALLRAHPAARIVAIEIDRGLVKLLRETFAPAIQDGRLTLLEGDVLAGKHGISPQFVEAVRQVSARANRPRRILCANLPYNVATPLLANAAIDRQELAIAEALVTIQLELAERLLAEPGGASYGALSALLALRAEGKILRRVGNEVFWPRPAVDSAVIRLRFKPWDAVPSPLVGEGRRERSERGVREPLTLPSPARGEGNNYGLCREEAELFQAFLQKLFSQRRKTLRAALKPRALPPALKLPPNARAEELPPDILLALFRNINETAVNKQN